MTNERFVELILQACDFMDSHPGGKLCAASMRIPKKEFKQLDRRVRLALKQIETETQNEPQT